MKIEGSGSAAEPKNKKHSIQNDNGTIMPEKLFQFVNYFMLLKMEQQLLLL